MEASPGYRFEAKVTVDRTAEVTATGRVQFPDRVYQQLSVAGQEPVELIFIGGQSWSKSMTGPWTQASPISGQAELSAAFVALGQVHDGSCAPRRCELTATATVARTLLPQSTGSIILDARLGNDGTLQTLRYRGEVLDTGTRREVSVTLHYRPSEQPVDIPV